MKKITLMTSISSLLFAGVSLSAEQDTFEKMMQFQTHVVCSSGDGTPPDPLKYLLKPPKVTLKPKAPDMTSSVLNSLVTEDFQLPSREPFLQNFVGFFREQNADSLTEQRNEEERFKEIIQRPLPSFKFDVQEFKIDFSSCLIPLKSTEHEISESSTLLSIEPTTSTAPQTTPDEE